MWIPVTAAASVFGENDGELSLKREWAAMVLVVLPALILAVVLGFYKKDVQTLLSGRQFVLLLVFFSPYLFAAVRFVQRLCRGAEPTRRKLYTFSAFFGILPAAVWAAARRLQQMCVLRLCLCHFADGQFHGDRRCVADTATEERKRRGAKMAADSGSVCVLPADFYHILDDGWESIPVEEILKLQ